MKLMRVAVLAGLAASTAQAAGSGAHHAAGSHAPAAASSGGERVTGPVATYWMSASTVSGMGAMMAGMGGGGRRPGLGAMMGAFGRGMDPNAYSHSLTLQLGSSLRPQGGAPQAEHDPPQALGAGAVLPLLTPVQQQAPREEESEPAPPPQYQQPKGRMLIYWGCGQHVGPGQPVVIDFSKIGPQGQGAQQLAGLMQGLAIAPMQPPSPSRDATYGSWPNERSRTQVPQGGSLQGRHLIKGNYSPDISFTLGPDQDFLPPIQLTTNVKNPDGSASLAWRPVDGAKGFFATMSGANSRGHDEGGDIVVWTSAQVRAPGFGLPEYLSDHEIARLVEGRVLMPGQATSCTVPQEVGQAAPQGIFRLMAYGGESNISYPPRPPAPQAWRIDWTVKVRYRAETMGMLGMTMPGMGGDAGGGGRPGPGGGQQQPHHPFNPFGGLGGMLP